MSVRDRLSQYGVLVVGLLLGGGFAFGGIASYSGMINTGSSPDQQTERPTLPSGNVYDRPANLSVREMAYLGYRNDVVFVTVLQGEEQVEIDRERIASEFGNRVYFYSERGNGSTLATRAEISEFPKAVAVSGAIRSRRLVPAVSVAEPTRSGVVGAICESMSNWGSAAAMCVSR